MIAERVLFDIDNTYPVVCDFCIPISLRQHGGPSSSGGTACGLDHADRRVDSDSNQMTAVQTRILNENKQLHDTVLGLKAKASAATAAPATDP